LIETCNPIVPSREKRNKFVPVQMQRSDLAEEHGILLLQGLAHYIGVALFKLRAFMRQFPPLLQNFSAAAKNVSQD
jgi:hypothetical protein